MSEQLSEKEISEQNQQALKRRRRNRLVLLFHLTLFAVLLIGSDLRNYDFNLQSLTKRAGRLVGGPSEREGVWVENSAAATNANASRANGGDSKIHREQAATRPTEREGVWTVASDGTPAPREKKPAAVRTKNAAAALSSFAGYRDGETVQGTGRVKRLLDDDRVGRQHQKFILEDAAGRTVLVAHSISIAPRLDGLKIGDAVDFCGEYRDNSSGGVIHWTHHDPNHRHRGGWLRWNGRVFD